MKNFLSWVILVVICCSVLGPVWEISPVLYYCCYAVLVSGVVIQWLALAFPILPMHFEGNTSQKSDARLLSHHLLIVLLIVLLGIPSGSVAFPYFGRLLLDFKSRMVHHPWWALCVVMVGIPVGYHLFLSIISILKNHKKAEEYVHDREEGRCPKGVEEQELPPDELSRTPIVELLYERLMECCEGEYREDGFNASRVGLFGAWGEGKTFVLKMLRRKILCPGENEDLGQCKKLELVDFNPWNCLDRKMQPTELFESIAKAVVRRSGRDIEGISRRFANSISNVDCRKFIAAIPNIGALISVIWEFVFRTDAVADKLKDELQRLDYHIVVVIDNVDRLPSDDICDLLRLISTHGDLPNIIYLVAADKEYMARAIQKMIGFYTTSLVAPDKESTVVASQVLAGMGVEDGHRYLEKIFTKRVYLPELRRALLPELFRKRMEDFCNGILSKKAFDEEMPTEIFDIVSSFLTTMRDVEVLEDAVRYEYKFLEVATGASPSIHLGDFIALTAMKYFEEDFYRALYRQMTGILKEYDPWGSGFYAKYSESDLKNSLVPGVDDQRWMLFKSFLEHCVGVESNPKEQNESEKYYSYSVDQDIAVSSFRLKAAACFENYFIGSTADGLFVTKSQVKAFLKLLSTGEKVEDLKRLDKLDFNIQLVKTCSLQVETLELQRFSAYVQMLYAFSDYLCDEVRSHLGGGYQMDDFSRKLMSGVEQLFSSLCEIMGRRPEEGQGEYSKILLGAIKSGHDMYPVARFIRLEKTKHFPAWVAPSAWLISDDYNEACKWYYDRIKGLLKSEQLTCSIGATLLMEMWRHVIHVLDVEKDAQEVLKMVTGKYPNVLLVVDSFLGDTPVVLGWCDQQVRCLNYAEMEAWLGTEAIQEIIQTLESKLKDLSASNFIHYKMLIRAKEVKYNNGEVEGGDLLDYLQNDKDFKSEMRRHLGK